MEKRLRHNLEWRPWWVILALAVGFMAFSLAAEPGVNALLRGGRHASGAGKLVPLLVLVGVTAVFLLYALLTIIAVCRVRVGVAGEIGLALAFIVGMSICRPFLLLLVAAFLGKAHQVEAPLNWWASLPGLSSAASICVILAAGFAGRLAGRIIREASLVPVVAVVAAGIDLWGVYWGPVGQITTTPQGKALASAVSAAVPGVAIAAQANLPVLSAVGIGDFLFLAIFFSALKRLRLNQLGAFWITFVILLLAPAFFLLGKHLPIAENLPGLPFIALGIIIANWKQLKLTREEVRTLGWGAVIIIGVVAGVVVVKRWLR